LTRYSFFLQTDEEGGQDILSIQCDLTASNSFTLLSLISQLAGYMGLEPSDQGEDIKGPKPNSARRRK